MRPFAPRLLALITAFLAGVSIAAPFAFIPEASGGIAVIDVELHQEVGRMTPGGSPFGIAVNPGGHRAYVTNFSRNEVHVIDTAARAIVVNIPIASGPEAVALNPAGTRLFVVHQQGARAAVTVFNTENFGPITTLDIGTDAARIALNPLGTRAYVSSTSSGEVVEIDTQGNLVLSRIATAARPHGVVVDPAGQRLYVTHPTLNTVSVVDIASRRVVASIPVGTQPDTLAIHPSSPRLYVSNRGSNGVSVVNTETQAVLYTMVVGSSPTGLDITPAGDFVYVANSGGSTVSVFYALQPVHLVTVTVGMAPTGVGRFFGGAADLAPQAPGILSGLWWKPDESGWGIHLTHRRNTVFAAWFTYDPFGFPRWMVASSCSFSRPLPCPDCVEGAFCAGDLFEASGPRFFSDPFDPRAVHLNRAGLLQIEFHDANRATMTYNLGSRTRVLPISRQVWATGSTPPPVNYTDLWWNPSESGWGLGITQQFGTMFLTWFVYEDTGRPIWYVASNCAVKASGNGCSGTLYQTRGPAGPRASDTFDASRVTVSPVGEIDVAFTDSNNGVVTYTVNRIPGSKSITRQLF